MSITNFAFHTELFALELDRISCIISSSYSSHTLTRVNTLNWLVQKVVLKYLSNLTFLILYSLNAKIRLITILRIWFCSSMARHCLNSHFHTSNHLSVLRWLLKLCGLIRNLLYVWVIDRLFMTWWFLYRGSWCYYFRLIGYFFFSTFRFALQALNLWSHINCKPSIWLPGIGGES